MDATKTQTQPEIFIQATLEDKITLSPRALCKNKTMTFQDLLAAKFEGVCSYHGYIKTGSIAVVKYTAGMIKDACLNGDVEYHVTYEARSSMWKNMNFTTETTSIRRPGRLARS